MQVNLKLYGVFPNQLSLHWPQAPAERQRIQQVTHLFIIHAKLSYCSFLKLGKII